MTRVAVYAGGLVAFAAVTAMTIAANIVPDWVVYIMYPTAAGSDPYWLKLGLHRACTSENTSPPGMSSGSDPASFTTPLGGVSAAGSCRSFPHRSTDCGVDPEQQVFCTVWRTIGFLMAVAIVVELVTLVGFFVVLAGGRMKREFGWRVLAALAAGVAALQLAAMALVTYVMGRDDRFLVPGWHLGAAWTLCTVSGSVAVLSTLGLVLPAYLLPPEDGYEFLRDPEES